ncbi:MAG: PAS domain-containing protein [Chloroflexi bacterium]|nr:PAS domain-containing protein [Chloroflexota bacterium]
MPREPKSNLPEAAWLDMVTHDGLFSVDSHQRIEHWSESAQRILGHRPEDVEGKLCYEVVGGRDSQNHRFCRRNCPVMVNARRRRPTPDFDLLCATPGEEARWINVSVAVPKKDSGAVGAVHMFRDVSHRRRTEEFARKATSSLRALLGDDASTQEPEPSPTPVPKLSPREVQVLRLLATGVTTPQIAETLRVSPVTARNHVTRLLSKLGAKSRLQAVVYASQRGII